MASRTTPATGLTLASNENPRGRRGTGCHEDQVGCPYPGPHGLEVLAGPRLFRGKVRVGFQQCCIERAGQVNEFVITHSKSVCCLRLDWPVRFVLLELNVGALKPLQRLLNAVVHRQNLQRAGAVGP